MRASGSKTIRYFALHGPERIPDDVGYPTVEIVDQEGCGRYDRVGIFSKIADSRVSTVKVTYHVTAARPVPDGAFELGFMGWAGGDMENGIVWEGSTGPVPRVPGNEKGGTITFTVRAINNDASLPKARVYSGTYSWPLDGCPGRPEPTPR